MKKDLQAALAPNRKSNPKKAALVALGGARRRQAGWQAPPMHVAGGHSANPGASHSPACAQLKWRATRVHLARAAHRTHLTYNECTACPPQ